MGRCSPVGIGTYWDLVGSAGGCRSVARLDGLTEGGLDLRSPVAGLDEGGLAEVGDGVTCGDLGDRADGSETSRKGQRKETDEGGATASIWGQWRWR